MAEPKEQLDDEFETIHLPFQSDIYEQLEISEQKNINNKNGYYKLCNLYKDDDNKLYSLQNEDNSRELISNAIILKTDVNEIINNIKTSDQTLNNCAKLVSDIPCNINNKEGVKEWIREEEKKTNSTINKSDILKCMNIHDESKDEYQSGGTNEKEEPKPEFYESLTKDKIQKCTLDKTPDESDWWNNEEKYVQINSPPVPPA